MEQRTPEWYNIRKGKMTASHAQAIGNVWKWLDTYLVELTSEYFSSWERESYSNKDMERWVELAWEFVFVAVAVWADESVM